MKVLEGKKLLVLGGGSNEISLVKRAQELGVFVAVADYNLDRKLSPAKNYADDVWDISWADIETLEEKCQQEGINGVLAGYSELRVDAMIQLCNKLELPCYITEHQLQITRDKIMFKNACRKNGVPVVKEYLSQEDVEHFPVIVKPTDRAGSIGVSIATNSKELSRAYEYAMEKSISKNVIIEDYISDSTKFDAYYQIIDGNISFVTSDDVINAKNNGLTKVVQSAWLLPSRYQDLFVKKIDPCIKDMIQDMGIQNGYIFFSGFANEKGDFKFFECGFRLCGGHYYDYIYTIGEYNTLDILIYYALTGSASMIKKNTTPNKVKCATINLYAKEGMIKTICGLDAVREISNCKLALTHAYIGQKCNVDSAILSKIGIIHFFDSEPVNLCNSIKRMYELVSVTNEEGEDMIYDRIDYKIVRDWWNRIN